MKQNDIRNYKHIEHLFKYKEGEKTIQILQDDMLLHLKPLPYVIDILHVDL